MAHKSALMLLVKMITNKHVVETLEDPLNRLQIVMFEIDDNVAVVVEVLSKEQ